MCDERLPDPPWVSDPSGWHSLDEPGVPTWEPATGRHAPGADEVDLEVACPECGQGHALGVCPYCGAPAQPSALGPGRARPSMPTHGQLILEIARLRTAVAQAVADIRANIDGGTPGTGAALALGVLTKALEERP